MRLVRNRTKLFLIALRGTTVAFGVIPVLERNAEAGRVEDDGGETRGRGVGEEGRVHRPSSDHSAQVR